MDGQLSASVGASGVDVCVCVCLLYNMFCCSCVCPCARAFECVVGVCSLADTNTEVDREIESKFAKNNMPNTAEDKSVRSGVAASATFC